MVGVRMGTPQWHCSDDKLFQCWREVLPCCASHSNPHGRCLGMIQSPLPSALIGLLQGSTAARGLDVAHLPDRAKTPLAPGITHPWAWPRLCVGVVDVAFQGHCVSGKIQLFAALCTGIRRGI